MTEKVISVITPVYPPNAGYLAAAADSLIGQALPDGWQWEWLVQVDGEDSGAISLPPDPRIKLAKGRHAGSAVARNLALARSVGRLVKAFDADDLLAEG